MATKTTGAELKCFYEDQKAWPDGWFHDDLTITVDGQTLDDDMDIAELPDGALVVLDGGVVYKGDYDRAGGSVESHFRKWRKSRATTVLVVVVRIEKFDAVKAAIASAGGKVIA